MLHRPVHRCLINATSRDCTYSKTVLRERRCIPSPENHRSLQPWHEGERGVGPSLLEFCKRWLSPQYLRCRMHMQEGFFAPKHTWAEELTLQTVWYGPTHIYVSGAHVSQRAVGMHPLSGRALAVHEPCRRSSGHIHAARTSKMLSADHTEWCHNCAWTIELTFGWDVVSLVFSIGTLGLCVFCAWRGAR